MGNLRKYAELELKILSDSHPDPENRPLVEEFIPEMLALIDKFSESGQSGGSAPYTANAVCSTLKKLMLFEPLCPVMGIDDEWDDMSRIGGDPYYQNKRCSALFKKFGGSIHYINAIVWRDEKGFCYTGSATLSNGDVINSSRNIKEFPFTPKTFYIDVISKEEPKDCWEFFVKDETQLDEVFEYYDRRD